MFSVVLVCLENFQEYILTNVAQLLRLGYTQIFILTNPHLFQEFEAFGDSITLIDVEALDDPFGFRENTGLDKDFRGGFWFHTSARFFVIHAFMKKYGVCDVIHIENDVLLYYNAEGIIEKPRLLCIPFDTFERNIASIVFIPDAEIFGEILAHYDFGKNDMYNFSEIRKRTGLIQNLPIFVCESDSDAERAFVSGGFLSGGFLSGGFLSGGFLSGGFLSGGFQQYIFDAAAIGQFVGGVDPRNMPGDTRGFVNETCVIKYADEGEIFWKMIDGFKKPFIKIRDGREIPIFNLHIHCKDLALYT